MGLNNFRSRLGGWPHIWIEMNDLTMQDLIEAHPSMKEEINEFLSIDNIELSSTIRVVDKSDKLSSNLYITFTTNKVTVATLIIVSRRIDNHLTINYTMAVGDKTPQSRVRGYHVDANGVVLGACTEDYLSEKLKRYRPNEEIK